MPGSTTRQIGDAWRTRRDLKQCSRRRLRLLAAVTGYLRKCAFASRKSRCTYHVRRATLALIGPAADA
jgi:hypothetical protein